MNGSLPTPEAEPRIQTSEICGIARLSRVTIQRRVKAHLFPAPIDRGKEAIFDRRAVYEALGIVQEDRKDAPTESPDPWLKAAHALASRPATPICRSQGKSRAHRVLFPGTEAPKA